MARGTRILVSMIVMAYVATGCADGGQGGAGPDAARVDATLRADAAAGRDGASIDGAPPPDAGMTTPPADPSQPGPYAVGVRTVMMTDPSRNRTLPVDIWYPAGEGGSSNTYRLDAFGLPLVSLSSPARRDAPVAAGGPWPLVLFSHGFGGIRFQSFFLTEHLASHGFVVAAPDHPGNTLTDVAFGGGDATQSSIDRPLDMLFVLDQMLGGSIPVDAQRIGVTGHSFGAWTALEVARRDTRFRAVFPMAPGFRNGSTPDFVADIGRPLAIFGGSVDHTCPFDANQRAPYDLAQTPKFLVEIMGAGHLDFSDLCEVPLAVTFVGDGCNAQNVDPAIVRARARTIATAFAHRFLDGESDYDVYLLPTYVMGLGNLQYWRDP